MRKESGQHLVHWSHAHRRERLEARKLDKSRRRQGFARHKLGKSTWLLVSRTQLFLREEFRQRIIFPRGQQSMADHSRRFRLRDARNARTTSCASVGELCKPPCKRIGMLADLAAQWPGRVRTPLYGRKARRPEQCATLRAQPGSGMVSWTASTSSGSYTKLNIVSEQPTGFLEAEPHIDLSRR